MTKANAKAIARIILSYILFGSLWILLSDKLLERVVQDPAGRIQWSIYKGWAYVFTTGMLLTFLLYSVFRSRERAAFAFVESERRFSLVFNKSPLSIAINRLSDNRYIDVNESFVSLTGYAKEEAVGHTPLELNIWVNPEERAQFIKLVQERRRLSGYEFNLRRKTGEIVPLLISGELINLSGTACLISIAQDISERKKMEESLRHQIRLQDRLTRLASVVPGIIYSFQLSPDGTMRIPFARGMTNEIFGRPLDDANAEEVFNRIHPDDVGRVRDSIHESAKNLAFWSCEFRVVHPEKGIIWAEGCSMPNREPDGSILWHGFVYDITDRKLAQERLRRFLISSPALLYVLRVEDNRAQQIWISENLQRILGWTQSDSENENWWYDNVFPEDKDRVIRARTSPRKGSNQAVEYRFRKKDGAYIWIRDEQRFQTPEQGGAVEVVGTWIDISEQKRLENQFQQAQKMETVGLLAGGIAHDFNNLLNVIKGYAELTLEDLGPADPNHKNLEEIYRASQRAASLTSQLLAFSRKQILQPEILNINDVLGEISKMLHRLIGENIELVIAPQQTLGLIHADLGQLQQIIMNLAINARDAMPDGGKLVLETANATIDEEYARSHVPSVIGEYVMLAVSDNGVGMEEETQARIFDPFFTTKEKGKGTGLGLSTVYGIVKQSKGFIWVYSEPGKGTTFKIYFPRAEGSVLEAATETDSIPHPGGNETVLVVEDEPSVRALTSRILRGRGYLVLEASNAAEALQIDQEHKGEIRLLITDVVMPGMGGGDLSARLQASRPGIRTLFVSGYTDDAIVHHGILDPDVSFLQKPYAVESLTRKVRELLDLSFP